MLPIGRWVMTKENVTARKPPRFAIRNNKRKEKQSHTETPKQADLNISKQPKTCMTEKRKTRY